ncbi:MAG: MFS transporter [Kineosporiaceae bacterium]|nr:MFS transporter [Kineosporiaceae bacterium]
MDTATGGRPADPSGRPSARHHAGRTVARSLRESTRRSGALLARVGRATARAVRRGTHAGGAGESGLARMIELHMVSSAADAMVVTALASTIFFAVPTEQARSQVITSLLVTMVPFSLLAPLIGPLLDRVRHGRRIALGVTMGARAWLAWVMASALADGTPAFSLYPAAFGFLVGQKSYLVIKAAALPRVVPDGAELLGANARVSAAGTIAMIIGAPLGVGVTAWAGPHWTLRLTFVLFLIGVALTLMLTTRVDADPPATLDAAQADQANQAGTAGDQAGGTPDGRDGTDGRDGDPISATRRRGRGLALGARSVNGLRGNAVLRGFTGFLTLFLAFRLRTDPLPGLSATTAVGLVIACAAVGGGIGTAMGALVRRSRPEVVVAALLVVLTLTSTWASLGYGLVAVLAVALAAGLGQSLGKLCLDALIQDEVPDAVRTSAFARSETALQLAWVLGGAFGLALPLSGPWGLGIATLITAGATAATLVGVIRLFRARPTPG